MFEGGIGLDAGFQLVTEFTGVVVLAEAPVGIGARGKALLQVILELLHGVQGGAGDAGIGVAEIFRNLGADGFVHQIDVALVFVLGHLVPDGGGGGEIGGGLVEEERDLLETVHDALDALRLRRVIEHQGAEQSVAQGLDVESGIVESAVYFFQIEQGEGALIVEDGEIGAILGGEAVDGQLVQTILEILVKMLLLIEAGGAKVIQLIVEVLPFVLVQTGGCGGGGRKR